jgi:hypothetical protein
MSKYCPRIQQLEILGIHQHNLPTIFKELQKNDHRRNSDMATVFPTIAEFIQYQK